MKINDIAYVSDSILYIAVSTFLKYVFKIDFKKYRTFQATQWIEANISRCAALFGCSVACMIWFFNSWWGLIPFIIMLLSLKAAWNDLHDEQTLDILNKPNNG